MAPIHLLELLILLTALAGFTGLLLRRNLFLKVLAMDVMGSAVVALVGLSASSSLGVVPTDLADPVPQAVILTAIVIGLSIQALLLVVVTQLARVDPSLDVSSFEPRT